MNRINPSKYEYLWTDGDVNFIFVSCYLFKSFRQADIILIYKWRTKELQFFLAKEQIKRFAHDGVNFFQHKFPTWASRVKKQLAVGQQLIRQTKKDRKIVSKMGLLALSRKFEQRVNFFRELGDLYFYSEFFFLGDVEKRLLNHAKPPLRLKTRLDKMAELKLKARGVLNEFYNYSHIFQPYIKKAGHLLKRSDMPWLSVEEIQTLFKGRPVPISYRRTTNWVLGKILGWELVAGKQAERVIKEFNEYFFNNKKKLIMGVCANPGKCKGRVRIIRTVFSDKVVQEIAKVKCGDILVANTTGPELTSAIKRAGAIITDEGGLTSHAAIVTRELGIPCIVGTKIATEVLKNGTMVEVDADKGTVKVL